MQSYYKQLIFKPFNNNNLRCRKAFYASIAHVFDSRRKLVDEAYKTIPQLIYEDRER